MLGRRRPSLPSQRTGFLCRMKDWAFTAVIFQKVECREVGVARGWIWGNGWMRRRHTTSNPEHDTLATTLHEDSRGIAGCVNYHRPYAASPWILQIMTAHTATSTFDLTVFDDHKRFSISVPSLDIAWSTGHLGLAQPRRHAYSPKRPSSNPSNQSRRLCDRSTLSEHLPSIVSSLHPASVATLPGQSHGNCLV